MSDSEMPAKGDVIIYTDEFAKEHFALVTAYFGGQRPGGALNCVYVSKDESQSDPYGNQMVRACSVSRQSESTAHGRHWRPLN